MVHHLPLKVGELVLGGQLAVEKKETAFEVG